MKKLLVLGITIFMLGLLIGCEVSTTSPVFAEHKLAFDNSLSLTDGDYWLRKAEDTTVVSHAQVYSHMAQAYYQRGILIKLRRIANALEEKSE